MKSIIVLLASVYTFCCIQNSRAKTIDTTIINIKDFGAKGDGITDDYEALLKASQYLNKIGTGILLFPKGKYYIAQFQSRTNTFSNIIFKNCNGLKIIGDSAQIIVNGDFDRSSDYKKGQFSYSYSNEIIPFFFDACKNVFISGFNISGGVANMRKDDNVSEGGGHLLVLQSCKNVTIKNMVFQGAQSDGIYIGGGSTPDSNVSMDNCVTTNNGRQGMSITFLTGGFFKNCQFLNTGITKGKYGFFKPAAGVDIEPNQSLPKTGDIVFESCLFKNNLGGQFFCTSPLSTSDITIDSCQFIAGQSLEKFQVILDGRRVDVNNCIMNLGNGNIYIATWNKGPGTNVQLNDCKIYSSASGIVSLKENHSDTVTITNSTFVYTGHLLDNYFPELITENLGFINNNVYIPSMAIIPGKIASLINSSGNVRGNNFHSDKPGITPQVKYISSQ